MPHVAFGSLGAILIQLAALQSSTVWKTSRLSGLMEGSLFFQLNLRRD
jgi:hypothetical protein